MSKEPPAYELPAIPVDPGYQPVPQTVQSHDVTVVSTQPGPSVIMADTKPENYLALSLFTCLCCCWVFGIIALVMSLQVDSAWSSGDLAGARRASSQAKQFSIVGIVCGSICAAVISVFVFIYIIAVVVVAATAASEDDDDDDYGDS